MPPPPIKASLNTSKNNSWHLGGLGMPGRSYQRVQQAAQYTAIARPAGDQCQVYIVHHKTTPLWAWNARTMPATNGTAYRGVCIVHNHIPLAFGHLQFNTSDSWMFRAHQPLQRTQDTTPMYSLACYTPDPYDQDHCPSHRMHRTPKNTPLLKVQTYFMPLYYLICFNLKQCCK